MTAPQFDHSYTEGEIRALIAPLFGLDPAERFSLAVVVATPDGGSAWSDDEGGWALLKDALKREPKS